MFKHLPLYTGFIVWLAVASYSATASAEVKLYRYKNSAGVQVINSSIPAEYSQFGYEVINAAGEILETVPPAPTKDAIEKANQQRKILDAYKLLKRRYSSIADIERAKQRKLDNINTNIAILNGNIQKLETRVDELVGKAAESERKGRSVPKYILTQLEDTKAELRISEDLLSYRKQEYREVTQKYDEDIRAFIAGHQLEKEDTQRP